MDLVVYTSSPVECSSELAQIREWTCEGDVWVCRARNWQVVVSRSSDTLDESRELSEIRRLRPDVRWRIDINVEGRQTTEATIIAFATAQRLAFRLSGAIYDPQQDLLSVPLSEGLFAGPLKSAGGGTQPVPE